MRKNYGKYNLKKQRKIEREINLNKKKKESLKKNKK